MAAQLDLPTELRLLLQNLSSLVQVKLDNTNYHVWRIQIQTVLEAHDLLVWVDGTILPPAQCVDGSPNPAYSKWLKVDRYLRSCLIASISPPVLSHVSHLPSASEIWRTLEQRFHSISRSHVHQLKFRLHTLAKGSKSIHEYLDEVKSITDSLASVTKPMDEDDLVLYILKGLPIEFDTLRASIRVRPDAISVTELTNLLIVEELHIQSTKQLKIEDSPSDVHSVLYTTQQSRGNVSSNQFRRQQFRGKGRGRFDGGRGRFDGRGRGSGDTPVVTCQICGKPFHYVVNCWYRGDLVKIPPTKSVRPSSHMQHSQQSSQFKFPVAHFTQPSQASVQSPSLHNSNDQLTL
ncbi:hypothetical protein DH2020_010739 [Rehmannia glutinosa]|uniref:Retrotransposon Copia-like N-terminal domain-containing protein n=1 Tax=Rehmannia glutinosa TaxID=99300 RepID=A0ABR0XBJ1_REHGL